MSERNPIKIKAGDRFERLTVIEKSQGGKHPKFLCRCRCGKVKAVGSGELRSGDAKSCGCLRSETTTRRMTKHGAARRGKLTQTYMIWASMRTRCDPNSPQCHPDYGGRGIRVCERWRESYPSFLEDMGECPGDEYSLDRFPDNDGNYEPGNVRWATWPQQARNKRNNRNITFNGRTQCLTDWAKEFGLSCYALSARLDRGWSVEDAITKPAVPPTAAVSVHTKLDAESVRAIRKDHAEGGVCYAESGRRYGVGANAIRRIVLRITWRNV